MLAEAEYRRFSAPRQRSRIRWMTDRWRCRPPFHYICDTLCLHCGTAFYDTGQFPSGYCGSLFVAIHGSFDRSQRTGSKVVRVLMKDGRPTGEYEDFLTGFTVSNIDVWGRPVGVTVTPDGALLVSDDASGTIWRVSYHGDADD